MNNEKQSSAGAGENGKRETKKYKRFGTRQEVRIFKNGKVAEVDENGVWSFLEHVRRRDFLILRNCDYCGNEYPARFNKGKPTRFCGGTCQNHARPKPILDEDRFFKMVTKLDNGCWIYSGTPSLIYGNFRVDGIPIKAHRYSYELVNGKIPQGLFACHKCDVPRCVNPDHLFLGTLKDNMQDCRTKGRLAPKWGENCGTSKLRLEQVLEIRSGPKNNVRFEELSRRFGVGRKHIAAVYRRASWKTIPTELLKP